MSQEPVTLRHAMAAALIMVVASCTAIPKPAPTPPPSVVRPAPPSPAPVPVTTLGWEDRALTPGDWRYDAASRTASYGVTGAPVLATLRCESGGSQITLAVPGLASATLATLRSTAGLDTLALSNGEMRFAVHDARLDRIFFSRGRFAIEDARGRALTLPVWAEIGRVIEDCRG